MAAAPRHAALSRRVLPWPLALAPALALALVLACVAARGQDRTPEPATGDWAFTATLDGRPIGTHRFSLSGPAGARALRSEARFAVRLFGIPVYRYQHRADERWQGDCLRGLRSETDDDGRRMRVDQQYDQPDEGECLMAFAYWNPRVVTQQRLVDPQTGRTEPVRFDRLPDAVVDVRGQPVAARGWRLRTARQVISIWYAAEGGRWVALDADVEGGRRLSYRLTADTLDPPKE